MDGDRITLVLDQTAGIECGRCCANSSRRSSSSVAIRLRCDFAVGPIADFSAMTADRGKPQRRKDAVDLGDRPSADEGNRAAQPVEQRGKRPRSASGDRHFERRRREIEQGAVDIEKNCRPIQVQRVGGQRSPVRSPAGFSGRCLRRTGLDLGRATISGMIMTLLQRSTAAEVPLFPTLWSSAQTLPAALGLTRRRQFPGFNQLVNNVSSSLKSHAGRSMPASVPQRFESATSRGSSARWRFVILSVLAR